MPGHAEKAGTGGEEATFTGNKTITGTLEVTGAVTLTGGLSTPLVVAQGGTGASTFTDGGILLGSGTGAITALGQATNGQLPIGSTGADSVLANITGTANKITVTNGAGTIALTIPDVVTLVTPTITGALVANGGSVFNEGSADVDFRIESDGNANMLVLDGGVNAMAIGTTVNARRLLTLGGTYAPATGSAAGLYIAPTLTAVVDQDNYGLQIEPIFTEAASGTHVLFAGITVEALSITPGGAALSKAAGIYIRNPPTGATDNYSIWSDAGVNRFDGVVNIGNLTGTNDGHVHILSPSTSTDALVVEMPSSATGTALSIHYGGVERFQVNQTATSNSINFNSADLGNDQRGSFITLGRNSNATSSGAGSLQILDKSGTSYFVHPDDAGLLRIGTASPVGTADTTNGVVGDQSSLLSTKDIIREWDDPYVALDVILNTRVADFTYKDGRYNGEEFTGIIADWSPEFAKDKGGAFNELNAFGYTVEAIKALNLNIQELEKKVKKNG